MKNLLTSPFLGGVLLCALFVGCFLLVHIVLLVQIGWKYQTNKPSVEQKPRAEEKPPEKSEPKPQSPVYYIVEKKRKKPKNYYSEPKEFHFK